MKKKKILLIINRKSGGGAEVVFQNLFDYFIEKGFNVKIFYHSEIKIKFALFRIIYSYLRLILFYYRELDVVISGLHEENFLNLLLLGKHKKILTIHSSETPSGIKNIIHDFMYRYANKSSIHLVFPSQQLCKQYQGRNPEMRGDVISNGLIAQARLERFHEKQNVLKNKKDKSLIKNFLFVGRFVEQKNIPLLLLTFQKIKKKIPEAQLTLAGDGPQRLLAEELIEKFGLINSVKMVGWVEDVSALYQKHDALLFTSSVEGFGNTIVEALAFGLIVFSTDCEYGPREILLGSLSVDYQDRDYILGEEFALIAYESNINNEIMSDRFISSIQEFCSKDHICRPQALKNILNHYTIENMGRRYEELF